MKVEFRATLFNDEGGWEDSEDGFTSDVSAVNRGKQYLSGAKDGWYVDIERIEKIKRVARGAVSVKAYK